ncbi:MAG: enolase C-terminal domain-like protein [Candidatus Latescibacterota bacterium]|jgi:L-alanine-DL-glutamate epimerase-like enolase superfamily enzyme
MTDVQMPDEKIVRIEKSILRGTRPRSIGYNARIATHGPRITDSVVRIEAANGGWGIGCSKINREDAESLLGKNISELFRLPDGSLEAGNAIDLPLWDLVARLMHLPLYRLLGARGKRQVELYDASIYIDDLEMDDDEAIDLFRKEVSSGQENGYKNFKIKVGRGARWMEPAAGLQRDALVIRTVRQATEPGAKIMIDANMGNTLNGAKALLDLCADVGIYWFEEPFAEDRPLNQALKEYIVDNDWDTLIADGEFAPPPNFFDLVENGLIDVVQHDFRSYGLTWWRATAAHLEQWDVPCAPHTWGSYIERYHHAHFAASIPNYEMLEAAPAQMPGLIEDGWTLNDGKWVVPDTPGAGIAIEEKIFAQGLEDRNGFSLAL